MTEWLAFFGAFNPPTLAHLDLAEFAMKRTGAGGVLFVPSKAGYIRDVQGKDYAYGDEERMGMLLKAGEKRPWMAVTDIELRSPVQPRTYETLCRLREGGRTAALLIGSDKLPELDGKWMYVEQIAREFGIVVLTRGADECARMIASSAFLSGLSRYIRVLETPRETRNVSSTQVRERIARIRELRREIGLMVPEEILPLL